MDDEQLHAVAAESGEVRCERLALQQRLEVLRSGKQILCEHMGESAKLRMVQVILIPSHSKGARDSNDENGTH